ncbi:MAG: tetratricopeptide repeat protein [Rhodospirillales bacterium]|nr:tetratricopeptide repeat protein [Rhodospirillales bacterium]MBT4040542.1 tetratricopeptide repeat protein [Rhodospirillales bacterium]MBT4625549.1 tetratricopeptide repeat protein [Rhodospirillales bacterium]MBT5352254.1 tetratricopeptide repeat protein [Rhodospirillales bacterium]MBT5519979.1 tetratricopeptide repeat protein [Rhodospirillales bacterium]
MADTKLAEDSDTGLLREIDEEIRQEHYEKLWKRYGKHVIAAAILLVVSVAGYKGWQSYDLSQRIASGQQFSAAISAASAGDMEAAQTQLIALAENGTTGYQTLAKFRFAALLSKQNDQAASVQAYTAIAGDMDVPAEYRDLAVVLATMNSMDTANADELVANLAPITDAANPWRHTARELSALALISAGNMDKAIEILAALSSDTTAPAGTQQRAKELLAALGHPRGQS